LPVWDYWIAYDLGIKRVISQPSPIKMSGFAIEFLRCCDAFISLHNSTLRMASVLGL
jgi:hypothetical protein